MIVCYLDYFSSANNCNNIELELNQTYCNSVPNGIYLLLPCVIQAEVLCIYHYHQLTILM